MAPFESTASAMNLASGYVLSSEAPSRSQARGARLARAESGAEVVVSKRALYKK